MIKLVRNIDLVGSVHQGMTSGVVLFETKVQFDETRCLDC